MRFSEVYELNFWQNLPVKKSLKREPDMTQQAWKFTWKCWNSRCGQPIFLGAEKTCEIWIYIVDFPKFRQPWMIVFSASVGKKHVKGFFPLLKVSVLLEFVVQILGTNFWCFCWILVLDLVERRSSLLLIKKNIEQPFLIWWLILRLKVVM